MIWTFMNTRSDCSAEINSLRRPLVAFRRGCLWTAVMIRASCFTPSLGKARNRELNPKHQLTKVLHAPCCGAVSALTTSEAGYSQ